MRFGWLPSQAMAEDWGTLGDLQARLVDDATQAEYNSWQANVRAGWKGQT